MPAHSIRDKTYPLLQSGQSPVAVSKAVGCSPGTAVRHARELHVIAQERLTPRYEWGKVQEYYNIGNCPTECMRKFKFSKTAWSRAEKLGKIVTDPSRRRKRGVLNDDLAGERYGKLTVIERVWPNSSANSRRWKCRCDCGTERSFTTGALKIGESQSCGCVRLLRGSQSAHWKGYGEIGSAFWGEMKNRALHRKSGPLDFTVTIEQAWNLFLDQKERCAISGVPLLMAGEGGHRTASLDRIDSNMGYVHGNVQWVHKWVNLMKLDHTMPEFIKWIDTIYEFQHHTEKP